jgi:hypothetical protein
MTKFDMVSYQISFDRILALKSEDDSSPPPHGFTKKNMPWKMGLILKEKS